MGTTIKTILLITVLTMLAASCSTSAADEAVAAETTTTVATTTTTVPPPDPAEEAAATQKANTAAFLAKDLDALMATYSEDIEFFNDAGGSHWTGEASMESNMRTILNMTDSDATEVIEQSVSADGTSGVVLTHWVGENMYGSPFDLTYLQLQEFEDGLIAKLTMYWEDQDVSRQLSANPDS